MLLTAVSFCFTNKCNLNYVRLSVIYLDFKSPEVKIKAMKAISEHMVNEKVLTPYDTYILVYL